MKGTIMFNSRKDREGQLKIFEIVVVLVLFAFVMIGNVASRNTVQKNIEQEIAEAERSRFVYEMAGITADEDADVDVDAILEQVRAELGGNLVLADGE